MKSTIGLWQSVHMKAKERKKHNNFVANIYKSRFRGKWVEFKWSLKKNQICFSLLKSNAESAILNWNHKTILSWILKVFRVICCSEGIYFFNFSLYVSGQQNERIFAGISFNRLILSMSFLKHFVRNSKVKFAKRNLKGLRWRSMIFFFF